MSTKRVLANAAADGSRLASAALRDIAEEAGIIRVVPLVVGDWVYILTATQAFLGQLTAIDDEEYVIGPDTSWVFETGPLLRFFGEGVADYCELAPIESRVRRGAIVNISRWPLRRHPVQKT
jgi:hypothetical protein